MKKTVIVLLISFFIIAGLVLSFASGETAPSKVKQITGDVTAVDTKTNTVTIQKKDKKITVALEEDTKITQCTMKTEITDIKVGDKVTARYKETGNQNTAKSITVKETEEEDN